VAAGIMTGSGGAAGAGPTLSAKYAGGAGGSC
jgi:hypothetical protein